MCACSLHGPASRCYWAVRASELPRLHHPAAGWSQLPDDGLCIVEIVRASEFPAHHPQAASRSQLLPACQHSVLSVEVVRTRASKLHSRQLPEQQADTCCDKKNRQNLLNSEKPFARFKFRVDLKTENLRKKNTNLRRHFMLGRFRGGF
jgi:hypothetical protein